MQSKRDYSTILYTNKDSDINIIICKALFKEVKVQETNQIEIESITTLGSADCVAVSLPVDLDCTNLLSIASKEDKQILLLKETDIREKDFNKDFLLNFILFNFELIRHTSVRQKARFLSEYILCESTGLHEKTQLEFNVIKENSEIFLNLLRIIAFDRSELVPLLIKQILKIEKGSDSFFNTFYILLNHSNKNVKICNHLTSYYCKNITQDQHSDKLFYSIINNLISRLHANEVKLVNEYMTPLMFYCCEFDHNGSEENDLSTNISKLPSVSKNLCYFMTSFLSKIFDNEFYYKKYSKLCPKASTKYELIYQGILEKVTSIKENGLIPKDTQLNDLRYGIYSYTLYLSNGTEPKKGNSIFDLLKKQ